MRAIPPNRLDINLLTALIERVEDSALVQGMTLSASSRAELVAQLYAEHSDNVEGADLSPASLTTDRLVWLYGT